MHLSISKQPRGIQAKRTPALTAGKVAVMNVWMLWDVLLYSIKED